MRKDTPVELLTDLLRIHTVNSSDREIDAAEYIAEYFRAHGIEAGVTAIDEKRGNVTACIEGEDPSQIMLWNGHLDTVPYGDREKWSSDPAEPVFRDGRIYARGASDMKSGLAAMVYTLCHLDRKPPYTIRFLGTCDEEKNGEGAAAALAAGCMDRVKWVLIGEPTGLRPGTAQKGCLWLEMDVRGKTGHGAYPERGANAVECAIAVAAKVRDLTGGYRHDLLGSSTAQITGISGGVANNMTPDRCRLVMDIRMTPGLSVEQVLAVCREEMRLQREIRKELQADFRILNSRRAIEISPDHPMAERIGSLTELEGYDRRPGGISFFTDASVLDRQGNTDILLFGPGDPGLAHQPDEYVETERYEAAVRILGSFAGKPW